MNWVRSSLLLVSNAVPLLLQGLDELRPHLGVSYSPCMQITSQDVVAKSMSSMQVQ